MPDKDTKKNETPTQDVQELRKKDAELGKLSRVSAPSSSTTGDDLTNAALQRQSKQEESAKINNTINDAYYSPIRDLTNRTSEMLAKRDTLKQQDEVAQRRSRNMQMIAGISDGLASLANLIGVADRGSNIDLGQGTLTPLAQRAEAARLERKADIKSIDDRLEQAQNQLMQMKLARGKALAAAQQTEQERKDKLAAELRGYAHQEKLKQMGIDAQREAAATKFKQTLATNAANNKAKKELEEYRQANANARVRYKGATTGSNATTLTILKGDDGKYYSYDLTKAERAAIDEKFSEAIKEDLKDPSNVALSQLYAKYETVLKNASLGIGTANKQEVEDLRNELIGMSPTLSGMIKKGRQGKLVPMDITPAADVDSESAGKDVDDVDALLNNNAVNP